MNEEGRPPEDLPLTETANTPASSHPERIGPYRILQKIGEGGMGEVYEAEQEKPVRRKVALKLIKWGMDTKQVVARFESERQALALMDHPGIAKVLDAGATEQGRPYFAMEYVKGEPIIRYCDKHRLTTRARLELFMQVCEGVQHAHQKGIIHRDLKPTNVLVTIQDDKAVPKIIDFGVAKATEQRLTEKTVFTQMGVLVGTPAYMSPEQAEMTGLDIDTRTDVYSLGVMLYELLVGALPFDLKELRKAGFDEIRRKIREDEPSKPSTRLSTLGDASTESAKRRRVDLPTLRRQLQGDLDWIAMKALEKDRTRRYGSPNELAADIQRHLRHEPVAASPPSVAYRTRKFCQRHKVGVSIAAGLVALLLGFGASMSVLYTRAVRAEVAMAKEARTAQQALDFMTGMFEVSDPSEARGNKITAREILEKGAREIEQNLEGQPLTQARLMGTMGIVYQNLGLYEQASPLIEDAVRIRRDLLGEEHVETLRSVITLGHLYLDQDRYTEAEPLYVNALETGRRVLGEDHPQTLRAMNGLASVYWSQDRYEEAQKLFAETLEARRRVLGSDSQDTLTSMNNLAALYWALKRYEEAAALFGETLEVQRRMFGGDHPDTLRTTNNLALVLANQGNYGEAEPLYLETLKVRERVLGKEHPSTIITLYNLACLSAVQGQNETALDYLRQAVERGFAKNRIFDDRDLASLHGDPEFEAIVAEVKKRIGQEDTDVPTQE